ncbi:MOSC domain-containing protein [Hymenobacter lapidiphilus]|uniref:MOSC domain-containing protein n=1 Tax=Hymenobacter lapidiphilus TaxID=2608003 RepID=A0A7Y7PS49_9BACT|nr:MOSC domain-containing protein [Hymenobacter lapidiphilus]NVO32857.1 MOSC domain-containing protein [Hymenobacter lapidiphilus]
MSPARRRAVLPRQPCFKLSASTTPHTPAREGRTGLYFWVGVAGTVQAGVPALTRSGYHCVTIT